MKVVPGILLVLSAAVICCDCGVNLRENGLVRLKAELEQLAANEKGKVGIAVITGDGDTIAINNDVRYPLMSVFKLHEALAVARELDEAGCGLDSIVDIGRNELNVDTWSPMLEKYQVSDLRLSVDELMAYMLIDSDNNASNLLFEKIVSVAETDGVARTITGRDDFSIQYTESAMQRDHSLSYQNWSSPLACAVLIDRVFTDSIVSPEKQERIKELLKECRSATDRLAAPLAAVDGVSLAHRTGSGYVNERGEIVAVNDVGFVSLPSGMTYAIAVLVKDYAGPQDEASALIGKISAVVYDSLAGGERAQVESGR